jgi:hypothetical protein
LPKVDVYAAGTVGTYCREKIPSAQTDKRVLEFPSISSEEYGPTARAIAQPKDVTLFERRPELGRGERIVVRLVAVGVISHRIAVETRKPECRVGLRGQPYRHGGGLGEVKHLDLPIVDLVQLGKGKVGLDTGR